MIDADGKRWAVAPRESVLKPGTIISHECPGEGRCHGCVCWCDECGDARTMCDHDRCDRHRCSGCNVKFAVADFESGEFRYWNNRCRGCIETVRIEEAERSFVRAAERGDLAEAERLAKVALRR